MILLYFSSFCNNCITIYSIFFTPGCPQGAHRRKIKGKEIYNFSKGFSGGNSPAEAVSADLLSAAAPKQLISLSSYTFAFLSLFASFSSFSSCEKKEKKKTQPEPPCQKANLARFPGQIWKTRQKRRIYSSICPPRFSFSFCFFFFFLFP